MTANTCNESKYFQILNYVQLPSVRTCKRGDDGYFTEVNASNCSVNWMKAGRLLVPLFEVDSAYLWKVRNN